MKNLFKFLKNSLKFSDCILISKLYNKVIIIKKYFITIIINIYFLFNFLDFNKILNMKCKI